MTSTCCSVAATLSMAVNANAGKRRRISRDVPVLLGTDVLETRKQRRIAAR